MSEPLDPDTAAFIRQNPAVAAGVSPDEISLYATHHAGGMYVMQIPLDDDVYVTLHDSWGPGENGEDGPIVVHLYSTDESLDQVIFFTDPAAAYEAFLATEAPSQDDTPSGNTAD